MEGRVKGNNGQEGHGKGGGSGVEWEHQQKEEMESGGERLL